MGSHRSSAIAVVVMMCTICAIPMVTADFSSADDVHYVLLDEGNGDTEWIVAENGSKIIDVLKSTLATKGHSVTTSSDKISVDGKETYTIGGLDNGGSYSVSGTTGVFVTCSWKVFYWDTSTHKWVLESNFNASYSSKDLAIGFYPDGVVPVETPEYKASWTSIGGDAELSFTQEAILNEDSGTELWKKDSVDNPKYSGVYGSTLYVQGYSFVKYGDRNLQKPYDLIECYDYNGNLVWAFKYDSTMLDTSTMAIYGDRIYIQGSLVNSDSKTVGYLYMFDWKTGPGTDNVNVKTYHGLSMADDVEGVPLDITPLMGEPYGTSFGSIVFDSGCLFVKHRNGMTYCFDMELNLVWAYLAGGYNYFLAPTVTDEYVFFGTYDGCLYALDKTTGVLVDKLVVYQESSSSVGSVAGVNVIKSQDTYYLYFSYNDGKGMSTKKYGYMLATFDGSVLVKKNDYGTLMGQCGNYATVSTSDDFTGVYVVGSKGLYKIDLEGNRTPLNLKLISNDTTHAAPVLVNGKYLYYTTYPKLAHKIYILNLGGEILKEVEMPISSYCMACVTVVDGRIYCGNDGGSFAFNGVINDYNPPVPPTPTKNLSAVIVIGVSLASLLVVSYAIMRFGLKWEHPLQHLRNGMYHFLYGEDYTHSVKKKHRLWLIMLVGFLLTLLLSMISLCVGPEVVLTPSEALKNAVSAISKGGKGLTYEELLIYNSRLPRTMAAFAVGIGLSIAGTIYQAIIKNPLVEPYIMGVSSGAGTFAVAVLLCDFTFFGLFAKNSPTLTIVSAMVGGLLAFALTMILSEKTGGKPVNYVLSGIIIGLVFGAVQSIMMISAGNSVSSALSWLYGSFASMTWDKLWLVLIPCLTLSVAPIVWAKEFNLVLLGEDQARQMGLDAHKFDILMLIMASVLTAFCVAFCGIIGFVGLVVPHLCRMIVGGDHRLVFPSAIAFGGVLMILADVAARALLTGYELPVGAITTIIGVPVFAYLLVKRGRSYD